jgi:putative DNA primase/helicase
VLRIRGRRPVRQGWRVPTLIIDALLDERLVKPFWPDVRVAARLRVKTPHTRFRQIIDRDFPQSALVPEEEKGDEEGRRRQRRENQRRLRRSRELRAAVLREARRTDGRVLVIAQKAVREYWESLGALPGNVEFGHCNAIAGIDRWGPQIDQEGNLVDPGVRLVVLAGRILPPAAAVETMARALTGLGLGGFAGGYLKSTAARRLLADGQTIPAETDWHPQEIAEAIRWQACEGELVQGGGRGRPANRTAANPLDVLIFADRPMPFPVEPVSWGEMAPDWRDLMLAEGGVALMNGTHAAKAYPKIRGDSGDDDAGITPNAIKLAR